MMPIALGNLSRSTPLGSRMGEQSQVGPTQIEEANLWHILASFVREMLV
jgi:hypothetical protein